MNEKPELLGSDAGSGVEASESSAEAKRTAARRRFLLGGAAALPMIVTLGQREAWAASASVCQSMGMKFDWKYAKRNKDKQTTFGQQAGGFQVSAYCDPNRRWG